MYNRDNFRDIYADKPKELTRNQYIEQTGLKPSNSHNANMSARAKRLVRKYNDSFRCGLSEVGDERHNEDSAINVHHIFPEADYPEISAFYENLIVLTPTQHCSYAHPDGNTNRVAAGYQRTCLLAKTAIIKETLEDTNREQIYDFGRFMHVLYVGFGDDSFKSIEERDFDSVVTAINLAYEKVREGDL
jgi:hypothetical protein